MPSWLASDEGPASEIVLSCRVRLMRNLAGHRFPGSATTEENIGVMERVLAAAEGYDAFPSLNKVERDHYVGTRLLSPDFPWTKPGRAVLFDPERMTAILVNEEDHLRLQVVTAGATWGTALEIANERLGRLATRLPFARSDRHGYLAASVYNAGEGRRISAMIHLAGLVTTARINDVLPALKSGQMVFRGLFGESSRAVGAFAQVSTIAGTPDEFRGAMNYLISEEARARRDVPRATVAERCAAARRFLTQSQGVSMADAVRALGLLRWGVSSGVITDLDLRTVDYALCVVEFRAGNDPGRRAENLRHDLNLG